MTVTLPCGPLTRISILKSDVYRYVIADILVVKKVKYYLLPAAEKIGFFGI